ncbi:hypothetical protein BDW02DRAFT_597024 [Decorospora gaudefroyi]|uniref:Uncharacterized protein n=1 Tax=Decorospora gaudefroyi TaxID=184978 RepID=A0A6A5KQ84_9PLEO|nr:hypothetical protein BDW02DRAFT_597024 [Decorospora gaudefroyi]
MNPSKPARPPKRDIRDFFSPAPRNTTSTANAALPQRSLPTNVETPNTNNAPTPRSRTPTSSENVPPAATNATTPLAASNLSFASTAPSTCNPSQASAPSGASRRVTSNGQQVVLNSDSDTDSLPDLDFGELAPRQKPNMSATTVTTTFTTRLKRASDDEDDGLRKPPKKSRSDQRMLERLVKTARTNLDTERKIREHQAALDQSLDHLPTTNVTLDEETLGQVVQGDEDDPDKARRLFQAMQRTNATRMESTFHFFGDTSDSVPARARFPINSLPNHCWVSNFQGSNSRDQAFLTGLAQRVFRIRELPRELASWMIEQICSDQDESLNTKYLEILESHHEHFRAVLDIKRLHALFKTIGANTEQLDSQAEIAPVCQPQSTQKPVLPPPLPSIAKLLQRAAPWLRTKARSRALYILCHVCLDDRVMADADTLRTVQDAIEAIICHFADNHRLTSAVGSPLPQQDIQSLIISQLSETIPQLVAKVTHPQLQRNLICAFPASSPLTAYLQRHLAISFFLQPTTVNVPLADPTVPSAVHEHLKRSSAFRINKQTDYAHLAARLALLDVAIGPGLLTVPYQPLISPATSQAGSSPIRAPVPATSEVRDFNKEIDALTQQIKLLGNSIVEAGAVVDLTIFDAKDTVERTCARLQHAVRIGGKKHHDIFGDDEDKQLKVSKYFTKTWKTSAPPPSIFDAEDDAETGPGDDMAI